MKYGVLEEIHLKEKVLSMYVCVWDQSALLSLFLGHSEIY